MPQAVHEISAAEFKAKCLKLMDSVQANHTELIITKRGKPVAKLVPCESKTPVIFGFMAGTGYIIGDIVAPSGELWDAEHE